VIVVLGQRLFALAGWIMPTIGILLVVLAALRVRFVREVDELTHRDDGKHWRSLPWEARRRHLVRFSLVNWAFTVVILTALIYGAWAAYWGWYRPGL